MYTQKRKQKAPAEKDSQDQLKQVKILVSEAKNIIEKATTEVQFQQALKILNKAILKSSSVQASNTYYLHYYRGICHLSLHRLDQAERDFIQSSSMADEKGKIQIYNSMGRCKMEMAKDDSTYIEEAIKCYERAIELSKNTDTDSLLKLASIYRMIKNNEKAIVYYTSSLDSAKVLKPLQQYQAYTERGLCYREIGQIQNSISDFIRACELKKQDASAYFNLGVNYLLNSKYELGLQKLDIAIQLNPSQPQFKNYKGLSLYLSGQYENCLHIYRQTLKLYEESKMHNAEVGECWYNLGNALLHLKQEDQAIIAFKMALNYQINQEQKLKVFYAQGLAYEAKGKIQAIQQFLLSLQEIQQMGNKNDALFLSGLYHLALNQHIHKKYSEAIRNVDRIVAQNCTDKIVYELRGRIYLDDQKYDLALKDFETLLQSDPTNPQVYYYLGMSKANLGEIDAAIADFFKSVQLGSTNIKLMNGISYAYLLAGKPDKALVYINIALQKQPNCQQFLIQRSMAYLELNQNHKGIQDLTKALGVNGKNSFSYYRRGLSYYKNKQFPQAIQDLKKSLNFSPSERIQHDIYYLMGVSHSNLENYQEAIAPFTKAIQLKKLPKYYHERAKCYILLDKNQQALSDLNQVIAQQPNNAFAYFRRALAYKALKMYEESADNFMKARQISPEDPKLIVNKKQIYQIKFRKLCEPGEQL